MSVKLPCESSMLLFAALLLLAQIDLASCAAAARHHPADSHHPDDGCDGGEGLESSYWKSLLESGRFRPNLFSQHHLLRFQLQLVELERAIEFYQNSYTLALFGKSFRQMDQENPTLRFRDILPDTSLLARETLTQGPQAFPPATGLDYLRDAYNIFQRLEMAAELVLSGLRTNPAGRPQEVMLLWQLLRRELQKIVRNVYTELLAADALGDTPSSDHVLSEVREPTRSVISREVRCVPHSAYRDLRDFVILRSIRIAAEFYKSRLQEYKNE